MLGDAKQKCEASDPCELAVLALHPPSLIYTLSGSAMISTIRVPKI
ncbi:MAG: hypothetical protein Q8M07_07935 [Prosthecobacter sp.]|nr:hypothetical protein [Prosthecobacter sp.]